MLLLLGAMPAVAAAQDIVPAAPADSLQASPGRHTTENFAYAVIAGGEDIFENSPEYDVAKALYGQLSGLAVSQGSGSSASNLSSISLHGKSPLILVDGYPRSLSDITASEIESIQVLKDAVSASVYGVDGGNGVILIKTKRGLVSPLKVTAKYQYGAHTPFRMPDFADAYTYAGKLNEALTLDGLEARYNARELEAFRSGEYPFFYPNVDWQNEIYRKMASNHRVTLTFRGGSQRFRYFAGIDYMYDDALYRKDGQDDRYDITHYDTRLGLRANVDVDITRTTLMKVGVMARLSQYNRANSTGIDAAVYNTPASAFPVRTEDGVWGGSAIYQGNNPAALLYATGAYSQSKTTVLADLNLRQDISALTEGLSAEISFAFDYIGAMYDSSSKEYRYSEVIPSLTEDGVLTTVQNYYGLDSKTLGHSSGFSSLVMRSFFEGKINYERTFDRHRVYAHAAYRQRSYIQNGRNNSNKTQDAYITAGYGYDDRYLVDLIASWSGTAYLPAGERFNFYPAANISWVMSNEGFMKGQKAVSYLKFFASGGISGFDGNMSHELYLQSYGGGGSYFFGQSPASQGGMAEGALPSTHLTPERSAKISGGFDLKLFDDRLSLYAEGYGERRSHILVSAQNISGVLGQSLKSLDIGIYDYRGVDFSIAWNDKTGDFSYGIWANGSYYESEVIEDGQAYQRYDYLYHKGNSVNQVYGLEFDGFFYDENDILNSPLHTFSEVSPGDIKYKDQNDDGRITAEDVVPLKGTTVPAFTFGFGLDLKWRNWELSADFSGRTGIQVNLLNSPLYKPMVSNANISDTFLEREITWTKENAGRATMPRLTTLVNSNNYRNSSLWFRDGSFIKLRSLMLSYTFPKKMIKFSDMKVYLQGTNLFSFDNLGFVDPEQLGAGYPSTRAFWAGLKFSF